MTKEEFSMGMDIPINARNGQVADKLYEVFHFLFTNKAKAVAVKVLPNEHKLFIKPFTFFKAKKLDNFFILKSTLKEELKPEEFEHISFMFADTFVEIWNKFMPMEFVFKYNHETFETEMLWDEGMTKKQMKAYWASDSQNGYNVDSKFWAREWLRPEHKQMASGTGKV